MEAEYVKHQLRLFGFDLSANEVETEVLFHPDASSLKKRFHASGLPAVVIAIVPQSSFCISLGIEESALSNTIPAVLEFSYPADKPWRKLRTLHRYRSYSHPCATTHVRDENGRSVWISVPEGDRQVLIIGSELAADIVAYRQGDPKEARERRNVERWGYAGERPNYLFESQLSSEPSFKARHADHWGMALATAAATLAGIGLKSLLPENAPGAILITGDDDQAYLDKYKEQLRFLEKTPITYFLHPLTRHDKKTLKKLRAKHCIDLGIHPDALKEPERYGELFKKQSAWFARLIGESAVSVRNHGYLNDGYWGHLIHWRNAGIELDVNLPDVDGLLLNGSLLPARIAINGELTRHWSLLTAFGDGKVTGGRASDGEMAKDILSLADDIVGVQIPGIIVVNLHPQNVSSTMGMHQTMLDLISRGFVAWTVRACLDWFKHRDALCHDSTVKLPTSGTTGRKWN